MSSSNVLYYCKYYRINISYCIQKNWYLPLYRKIKSLLYIQLMTGRRCLAWEQDYNTHPPTNTHTTGGLYDSSTLREHVHAASSHSDALSHMHHRRHTRTSPSLRICHRRAGKHSKYGTNHEHELEGYFSVGEVKFRIIRFPNFLCKKHILVSHVTRSYVGVWVLHVNLSLRLSIYTCRRHYIVTKTLSEKMRLRAEKCLKITLLTTGWKSTEVLEMPLRVSNRCVQEELGVEKVCPFALKRSKLRWSGHLVRMTPGRHFLRKVSPHISP